ncbi:Nup82p [Saccharomyces cerevisiae YJM1478]|nr:Nup82p [Saccharomyces cerevisiae YJM271]AJR73065.1 Nup82p [Saccharomyces cerevisiae YJM1478]AJR74358.1 Nup82p [Saccharomyces cerevisiae YJM1549]CAI4555269.1 AAR_G0029520.mRNA.1.CDS.1 [Saccharomyces cerevisiae]CAI4928191.1 CFC_HP_G0048560.mRNA.1.CDS.1 [Saccharomyces cerevisiae]
MSQSSRLSALPIFQASLSASQSPRYIFSSQNGTRIVFIQDNIIRWYNVLTDSLYHSLNFSRHLVLDDTFHVISSTSGDLLCFFNDNEIFVMEVPWGYSNVEDVSIQDAFQIFHYSIDEEEVGPKSSIKKVLFHPKSYRDSCIVVLKEDDTITMFDILNSQEKPIVLNKPNNSFGLDARVNDITDLEFSKDGLTLYCLNTTEGGDIFAFYPFLPSVLLLNEKDLNLILNKSLVMYESLDSTTDVIVKRNVIKQLQFVSKLHENWNSRFGKVDIQKEYRLAKVQGPFTINPFPGELYDYTATNIATILIDNGQNEIVCVSFDDGSLILLFKDLEMSMSWDVDNYVYNNSLVLIERVKLQREIKSLITLPEQLGKLYVISDNIIQQVNFMSWASTLSKCINESDLNPLAGLKFESKLEDIATIERIPNLAYINWNDQSNLALMSNKTLTFQNISSDMKPQSTAAETSISTEKSDTVGDGFKMSFTQPINEILILNDNFQKACISPCERIIPSADRQIPLKNEASENQLEIFTDISKEFLQRIVKAQTLGVSIHNRIHEQQFELTRQLQSTCKIISKDDDLRRKFEAQNKKWDAQLSRQSELMERFSKLSKKLSQIAESNKFKEKKISHGEMKWFKEIRNQILQFNSFVHSQKSLQQDLSYLKSELTRIEAETIKVDKKSQNEWDELRKMLEIDSKIIKECNEELLQISQEFTTKTQ